MSLISPARVTLVRAVLAVAAVLTPTIAHAQALLLTLTGGVATPVRPTYDGTRAGTQFGIGLSHRMRDTALSLGGELSIVHFGGRQPIVYYPVRYALACPQPGCASPTAIPSEHLGLVNYFATAKYDFGVSMLRPYLALAGGLTQKWGVGGGQELNGGGRATAGVESQLGRVGVALDVSYATVSTLKYEGNLVRYVPVTLRLSF